MRITRQETEGGAVYLVFRKSYQTEAVKQVLRYAQDADLKTLLGSTEPGSGCMLTIGPLQGDTDVAFKQKWRSAIEEGLRKG